MGSCVNILELSKWRTGYLAEEFKNVGGMAGAAWFFCSLGSVGEEVLHRETRRLQLWGKGDDETHNQAEPTDRCTAIHGNWKKTEGRPSEQSAGLSAYESQLSPASVLWFHTPMYTSSRPEGSAGPISPSAPRPCPSLLPIFPTPGLLSGARESCVAALTVPLLGFSRLLLLAPYWLSQILCPNIPTSWRPQTHTSPNCAQPMTSSTSGRLEPHRVNSFQLQPFWISFSVSSPTPPLPYLSASPFCFHPTSSH